LAVAVIAFTLYIVIVDMDLTAVLVGLLIVFTLYAIFLFLRLTPAPPSSPRLQ